LTQLCLLLTLEVRILHIIGTIVFIAVVAAIPKVWVTLGLLALYHQLYINFHLAQHCQNHAPDKQPHLHPSHHPFWPAFLLENSSITI
jgi:hypothetical protein